MTRFPRITLSLPLPPSINHTHGIGKITKKTFTQDETGGRIFAGFKERQKLYRMPHYKRWCDAAGDEVIAARPRLPVRELPARRWYCFRALWPAGAAPDVDNPVKVLIDFLTWMRITPDDRLCWRESATRSHRIEPGRCEVTVWSLPEGWR